MIQKPTGSGDYHINVFYQLFRFLRSVIASNNSRNRSDGVFCAQIFSHRINLQSQLASRRYDYNASSFEPFFKLELSID